MPYWSVFFHLETAARIAKVLDVSLDYLVGHTDRAFDHATLKRIEEVDELPEEERRQVYRVIDALLRDAKAKNVYA